MDQFQAAVTIDKKYLIIAAPVAVVHPAAAVGIDLREALVCFVLYV